MRERERYESTYTDAGGHGVGYFYMHFDRARVKLLAEWAGQVLLSLLALLVLKYLLYWY